MAEAIQQASGTGQLTPEFAQQLQQMIMGVVQQVMPPPDAMQQMVLEIMQQEHKRLGIGGPPEQRQIAPPGV